MKTAKIRIEQIVTGAKLKSIRLKVKIRIERDRYRD